MMPAWICWINIGRCKAAQFSLYKDTCWQHTPYIVTQATLNLTGTASGEICKHLNLDGSSRMVPNQHLVCHQIFLASKRYR
jgi:hypothetical protein